MDEECPLWNVHSIIDINNQLLYGNHVRDLYPADIIPVHLRDIQDDKLHAEEDRKHKEP